MNTHFTDHEPDPGDSPQAPNVLIVDDEPSLRMGFRLALVTEGYQVEVASNGEEALKKLKDERFDLMILDLRMPGIDGIGVLRSMANSDPLSEILVPTVVASAQMDDRVALQALRFGVADFLNKPIRPEDLRGICQQVLEEEETFKNSPDEDPAASVHRTRCLIRRRNFSAALAQIKAAPESTAGRDLWLDVAQALIAAPPGGDDPLPKISLRDLLNG